MQSRAAFVLILGLAVWQDRAELSAQPPDPAGTDAASDKANEAARLESLWQALGSDQSDAAEQAASELAKSPDTTIKLAEQHLAPLLENQGQAIQELIRALDDDKYANREAAEKQLAAFGLLIRPQLRQAITPDTKPEPFRRLERLLAGIPESEARSADERRWTRLALLVKGIDTPGARALAQALTPAAGLIIIDPQVAALMDRIASPDPKARATAALELIEMGRTALPVLPRLIGLLDDESPHVAIGNNSRSVAAHVVAAMPQLGALAVEPLIAALKDTHPRVRANAATVLASILDTRAIGPLIEALADPQSNDSARAALEKFGPGTAAMLIKLLDAPNPLLRRNAAHILGRVKALAAIEPLAKLLNDDDQTVRNYAVEALRQFGAAALDNLIAALKSGHPKTDADLRTRTVMALVNIRDPRAREQLLTILSDEAEPGPVRTAAISLLAVHLNDLTSDPRLEKVLSAAMHSTEPDLRAAAINLLGHIAHYNRAEISKARMVDLLIAALDDPNDKIKRAALQGLANWRDPRAADRLLTLLDDEGLRGLAATALGQIGDRRAIEPLRRKLGEKDPRVIVALGKLGDRDSLETIVALLGDEKEGVRYAAIEALGNMKDNRATEPLLAVLASSELVVKGGTMPLSRLAQALGEIKDPRAAEPLIAAARRVAGVKTTLRPANGPRDPQQNPVAWPLMSIGLPAVEPLAGALSDPSEEIRELAAWVLCTLAGQRRLDAKDMQPAIAALAVALGDSSEVVRHNAAMTLGQLGDRRAAVVLVEILAAADDSHRIYFNAANSLGALREPDSFEPLLKLLSSERPATRVGALRALAIWGDARALEPIVARLDDPDTAVRAEATAALARLEAPAAVKPLMALLADKQPQVRRAAATSLGRLGDRQASDPLAAVSDDHDPTVRLAVGMALAKLDDARGLPIAARCLADPDRNVREAAALELSNSSLKNPDLLPPLVAALDDPELRVRLYSALAVGNIGTPAAVDALAAKLTDRENLRSLLQGLSRTKSDRARTILIERLDDTDPMIRGVAAASLGFMHDEQAVPALVQHLKDSSPEVRRTIVEVLTGFASKAAIEPLTAALKDDDPQVRLYAERALSRIEK